MRRLRLVLEYDGALFCGWQAQARGRSVQGAVEAALGRATGGSPASRVTGAARTDAGVHARGQVVHVDTGTRLPPEELEGALGALLPPDIGLRRLERVEADFHARRDARCKQYAYRILEARHPSPLRRGRTWHLRGPLDLQAMARAARRLEGTHDYAAFRGAPGGAPPHQSTRRTLQRLEVIRVGDEVRIVAEGPGFLRYMVRNLVGTLVEVGLSRRDPDGMEALLASGERAAAGPTAPPHGLCLEWVAYDGCPPERRGEPPGGPAGSA